ncbi:FUSC family protein [Vibrio agarivorans]|uniref:FUSC family protein n=1 Tax=Vibrio agarivorans TaxID=153622 RepID=UPI00222F26BF|nr:FUSC family protein [Vibrio agarivorans]
MLEQRAQEAFKVALSIALSIIIALAWGWDRAYWTIIAVSVIAATESYSQSVEKAQNRILGTGLGIITAFSLVSLFPQSRELFLTVTTVLLFVCVYLSSHIKFGYMFRMTFTVFAVIASSGQFDSDSTFLLAVLRMEQTLLALGVYSLVSSLLWPEKKEQLFWQTIESVWSRVNRQFYDFKTRERASIESDIETLRLMLSSNLRGYRQLTIQKAGLLDALDCIELLNGAAKSKSNKEQGIREAIELVQHQMHNGFSDSASLDQWVKNYRSVYQPLLAPKSAFSDDHTKRFDYSLKACCIFITGVLLWIYVPVPGGYVMPLMSGVLANSVSSMPNKATKLMGIFTAIFATLYLIQYVTLLPQFTGAWQLFIFYFINVFIMWFIGGKPGLEPLKIISGNMLANFTSSALSTTPSYSMTQAFTMLTVIYFVLMIVMFYNRLFEPNEQ